MIRIRYVIILPRVAGGPLKLAASELRVNSVNHQSLLAPVARQAAQSFRSRRLLSLPGRIAHDPDQGCAAICMRGSHPRQHRSGVGGRPRRLDGRVFGIFGFVSEAIMCVLPMQPDNEGVRQMRGCGGLDGGGIAADYNGQTSSVLGEFWPDAEERQCAADLSARIGLGWFGCWRFRVDQRDGGDGSTRTPPSSPSTVADTSNQL